MQPSLYLDISFQHFFVSNFVSWLLCTYVCAVVKKILTLKNFLSKREKCSQSAKVKQQQNSKGVDGKRNKLKNNLRQYGVEFLLQIFGSGDVMKTLLNDY